MDYFNIEKYKTQLKHEPRGGFETSMMGPMGISVSLVTRKIVQGLKTQGYFWTYTFHVAYRLLLETTVHTQQVLNICPSYKN